MEKTDKTFAETYGLKTSALKVQKNIPAGIPSEQLSPTKLIVPSQRLANPLIKSYQTTKKHHALLDGVQTLMRQQLNTPVGHSTILRAMIELAATQEAVRIQLMMLIQNENVKWGSTKTKPERKKK